MRLMKKGPGDASGPLSERRLSVGWAHRSSAPGDRQPPKEGALPHTFHPAMDPR